MLDSKWFSSAAHAAHDLVRDEENTAVAADLCDALGIAVRRDGGAKRGTDYRFEDKRSDACRITRA